MRALKGNFIGTDTALFIEEQNVPQLGPNDVLIKVRACEVNLQNERIYHQLLSPSVKSCAIGHNVSGEIVKVGPKVDMFEEGMSVCGVTPLDSILPGCADLCVLNQFDVVEKPQSLSHETAAVGLSAGLAAYTAVHYLGHVTAGDTVLVIDGATPQGYLTLQAAQSWGAKVLSGYKSLSEKQFLEGHKPPIAQLIELTQRTNVLPSSVMEETGGVGVDCIIDNGVRLFTSEEDKDLMEERNLKTVPHKNDIISSLGFSGKWITSQPRLQLDPPDSQQLFLRGASLSFLFPPAWTLMKAQHGRYQHILKDLMTRLDSGEFKCNDVTSIPLEQASEMLVKLDLDSTKGIVVVP